MRRAAAPWIRYVWSFWDETGAPKYLFSWNRTLNVNSANQIYVRYMQQTCVLSKENIWTRIVSKFFLWLRRRTGVAVPHRKMDTAWKAYKELHGMLNSETSHLACRKAQVQTLGVSRVAFEARLRIYALSNTLPILPIVLRLPVLPRFATVTAIKIKKS